jgi:hypothetical protein
MSSPMLSPNAASFDSYFKSSTSRLLVQPSFIVTTNLVYHRRTKHIEIDIHFIREKVALDQVRILLVRLPTNTRIS